MTIDEFTKEIEKLVEQIPDKQHVFILFYDDEQKNAHYCGIGCEACAFDMMLKMAITGQFKHNGPDPSGTKH